MCTVTFGLVDVLSHVYRTRLGVNVEQFVRFNFGTESDASWVSLCRLQGCPRPSSGRRTKAGRPDLRPGTLLG